MTYLSIACSQFSASVTELIPLFESGLNKGLLINIFFGGMPVKEDRTSWAAFEALKKLEYDSSHGKHAGRLVLGTSPTGCSTNIAFADVHDGPSVIIGSYVWTAPPSCNLLCLSVQFENPWIVAHICEILAGFSSADERLRLGAGFIRLKKAAGALRQKAQMEGSDHSRSGDFDARLVLDKDQQQVVHSMLSAAQESIIVFTDDLIGISKSDWTAFLLEASERLGSRVCIVHCNNDRQSAGSMPMTETMLKYGVRFQEGEPLVATIITVDNRYTVITTSRSSLISPRQSYAARIGIAIKGQSVSTKLFQHR